MSLSAFDRSCTLCPSQFTHHISPAPQTGAPDVFASLLTAVNDRSVISGIASKMSVEDAKTHVRARRLVENMVLCEFARKLLELHELRRRESIAQIAALELELLEVSV